ncbi:conjugative transposon protein TraJ [Pedobacter sp. MC2016-15]|uniref:conjugative transposon protein TraJ n=1 Tax=Pedobacter sp. MC2016-15 TaxID=2994473 RepID=UPI002247D67B|nr:conjugative transposon protein TraJ [Pedobacter sp. MC2016-15]MCX2479351.1 conjugative transposon protein TraJ [Pedobacter sp. MC2016-15]
MIAIFAALATLLPQYSFAQGLSGEIGGLQKVLDNVYNEMLPLCSKLIGVARGLAGFGALWYIASRVWRQIAAAEAVDFYPLLRPFGLGLAIMLFPVVISVMNGILQPIVIYTRDMVTDSDKSIATLLKIKEAATKKSDQWKMYVGDTGQGDSDKWYKMTHPLDPERTQEGVFEGIGNDVKFWMDKSYYNFRNNIKQWMSEILQLLFAAAALCINTIRTFYLIVLAILGPIVFGIAVFDGFQHTLTVWVARYINTFMWLPVANIFGSILGKIQENMLKIDISQIGSGGDTFFTVTDTAYLVFMVIGIIGYTRVPSVANAIVHAGGGNGILTKVNSLVMGGTSAAVGGARGGAGMIVDRFDDARRNLSGGMAEISGSNYFKHKVSGK